MEEHGGLEDARLGKEAAPELWSARGVHRPQRSAVVAGAEPRVPPLEERLGPDPGVARNAVVCRRRGSVLPQSVQHPGDGELGERTGLRAFPPSSTVPEHRLQLVERRLHPGAAGTPRVGEHDAQRVPGARGERRRRGDAAEERLGGIEVSGALGLEATEQEHALLRAGGRRLRVRVREEEGRDQELLVQPLLRPEQRLDCRRLRGPGDGSGDPQRPERGRVEVRGLERLAQRERLRRCRRRGPGGGEQLRRRPTAGAAEQREHGQEPSHSCTPMPKYTPTTFSVSVPPSLALACAMPMSLLRS